MAMVQVMALLHVAEYRLEQLLVEYEEAAVHEDELNVNYELATVRDERRRSNLFRTHPLRKAKAADMRKKFDALTPPLGYVPVTQ